MMLSFDDRVAIADLLSGYCFSLDDHDWESFLGLFTEDAELDYTAIGGPTGNPQEMVAFFKGFASSVTTWQHTTSTNRLVVDGDRVKSRTAAQVMTVTGVDESSNVGFFGLWYHDEMVKTDGTWLMSRRVLQSSWAHNLPDQA